MSDEFEIATQNLETLRLSIAEEITKLGKSERVNELLACSFGRVIVNEFKRGELSADDYGAYLVLRLEHIADWIEAAVANDEPWLKNVDELGRPKKLLKFANAMQIVREANRDMMLFAQKSRNVVLSQDDEELVKQFDNGYSLVRLLTPRALDRESGQMQHCIGQGAYDQHLEGGEYEYLSLRDPAGKPHVTMEIGVNRRTGARDLKQFQGKQNQPPISKYQDILIPYLREAKVTIRDASPSLPYITDDHGTWHSVYDLPEELEIKSLRFIDYAVYEEGAEPDGTKPIRLPKRLIGTHSLSINGACLSGEIESHPDDMNISLNNVHFTERQTFLKTTGDIHFTSTTFVTPPELIEAKNFIVHATMPESWPKMIVASALLDSYGGSLPNFPMNGRCGHFKANLGFEPNDQVHDIEVSGSLVIITTPDFQAAPRGVKTNNLVIYAKNEPNLEHVMPDFPEVSGIIDVKGFDGCAFPENLPDSTRIIFGGEITLGEYRNNQQRMQQLPFN